MDQTCLPSKVIYLAISDSSQVIEAIQNLRVRGAPAIGVAGAYALYLAAKDYLNLPLERFWESLDSSAKSISSARPTAVNLAWAVTRAKDAASNATTTLEAANLILAEDTRTSKKLLNHLAIQSPIFSFHQHNEHKTLNKWIAKLKGGEDIALISDAGTPGISDPGFLLVRECVKEGIEVECLPGATAFVPA